MAVIGVIETFLDVAAIAASLIAAWFWYLASSVTVHRMTIDETFDYHDLNRVIVSINRNALRNRTAALASAIAAVVLALDLAVARIAG